MLGLIGLLGAIALILAFVLNYFDNQQKKGHPPLIKSSVPFLGQLLNFANPLPFLSGSKEKYGNIFRCKVLGRWLTFVVHPEHHQTFFLTPNAIFSPREVYTVMTPIFGKGCVYDAEYPRMKEQLNFVARDLSVNNFYLYVPIIKEEALAYFKAHLGASGRVNLLDHLSTLIVKTASRCLLGDEAAKMLDPVKFSQWLSQLEEGINPLGVFYPWLPSPGARKRDEARALMYNSLLEIIQKKKESIVKNGGVDSAKRKDVVESLCMGHYVNGEPIPDNEKVGVLIGAMFAGQHTSAIASSWTSLHVAHRPKVLAQVRAEREEFFNQNPEASYSDHIKAATYLEGCVKESLRLNPPLIMLMRHVKEDAKVGEYTVPKGDMIVASPLISMRCPDVWPNPEEYDPSRFKDTDLDNEKKMISYIGFGAGAHRCLGQKFGTMQSKTIVATLFDTYDITIEKGDLPENDWHSMVVGPKRDQCWVTYKIRPGHESIPM